MPVGIILNAAAIFIGGLLGAAFGSKIPDHICKVLPAAFGSCSMLMGISNIIKMKTMPAVVLSIIVGTIIGEALCLENRFRQLGGWMGPKIASLFHATGDGDEEVLTDFVSALVLFCASGTGIFGALQSGLNGDHTLLITKSILDFFTAIIFAVTVRHLVAFICFPQLVVMLSLFFSAKLLMPVISDSMLNDFMACGGILTFVTGFRIVKVREFPIGSMLPAVILVMPVSWLWTSWIAPLLG